MSGALRRIGVLAVLLAAAWQAEAATRVLVVAGLGGEAQYDTRFAKWSEQVALGSVTVTGDAGNVRRLTGGEATRERIEAALRDAGRELSTGDQFVLVLLGHGSFDGNEYRFNIAGPDITGTEIAALLDRFAEGVAQLVVNATSTSGAVAEKWKRPNRVVVTATKSGGERNATRFGAFWAEALANPEADRDKDGNITAQEAYDYATRKVTEAFKSDAAMATEHSLLVGTDAARFVVARQGAAALFASDAQLNALRGEQQRVEQRVAGLRARKPELPEDEYYAALEPVLLEMARLGTRIDARLAALGAPAGAGDE